MRSPSRGPDRSPALLLPVLPLGVGNPADQGPGLGVASLSSLKAKQTPQLSRLKCACCQNQWLLQVALVTWGHQ